MKTLSCKELGERPVSEFVYGGAANGNLAEMSTDVEWAEHVFHRDGTPGKRREWWYHRPSGTWYFVERDTATDVVTSVERVTAAVHGA